ncbi:hypothetical protein E2C01_097064 [Portunus trituberculatus]|uniref:Uncharacterized protein n=1 Tax=Portunus trituberculatus TaxID=210409 RepID=A0A5B7JU75_PORTR|nr:hypothetical protein [Portunus trituberculatus]
MKRTRRLLISFRLIKQPWVMVNSLVYPRESQPETPAIPQRGITDRTESLVARNNQSLFRKKSVNASQLTPFTAIQRWHVSVCPAMYLHFRLPACVSVCDQLVGWRTVGVLAGLSTCLAGWLVGGLGEC